MKNKLLAVSAIVAIMLTIVGYVTGPPKNSQSFSSQSDNKPTIGLTYTLQDRDAQGKLVCQITRPSRSYVQGFLCILYCQAYYTIGTVTIKDTGNTSRALLGPATTTNNVWLTANATAGNTNYGIVAGTGTNAVTETDYALQTLIPHGTGAGQLSYGNDAFTAPSTIGSTSSFTISRTLTNNSSGSITINEIGMYGEGYYTNSEGYFCEIRDVLGAGQVVASTHNLAITYTIAVTN